MDLLVEYPFLLVPLIFFARVADVSLGTFRTIVVFRGNKLLASIIGFFEIMIWLVAAGQVLTNLDHWYLAVAYAGGFAVGNYVGISIESHFAIGKELIRCISFNRDVLADKLREQGFKVVSFDGDMGEANPVELLLIIEKRRNTAALIQQIKELDPSAVYSVSDIKSVYDGPDLLPRRRFYSSLLMQKRS
ncbi:MAG: DUF2179 domain-containing protein [Gammaproteobacteria bacterium]|jgi:uncharacterized protein YebE (UPF0316 family)|nr:DUF2179 domain-containing protein [Zhongshania sp.]MBU0538007.1 DUF2179 domain-containing protein [Gammaproteobacteria bacterium]MBU1833482.1 DUF2179 domain-containing protein [Gammaproteobacteria bacterium]